MHGKVGPYCGQTSISQLCIRFKDVCVLNKNSLGETLEYCISSVQRGLG